MIASSQINRPIGPADRHILTGLIEPTMLMSDQEKSSRSILERPIGGDHLPIWIASELWDFGSLSMLFGGLKKADQTTIGLKYGIASHSVIESWIRSINFIRNVCAHHFRLWNKPSVLQPRWPAVGVAPELDHLQGNVHALTRLYGTAALVRFMLRAINPTTTWPSRLATLTKDFPASPVISLSGDGFPSGWEAQPLWR